jgi:hypothetical protein
MEFVAKQIAPPKSWATFEDLCRALFSAVWRDPYAQKNGRTGQPQHGVDVWGQSGGAFAGIHCVQCKGKDGAYGGRVTAAEFDRELEKAAKFEPSPSFWILATTAPNDEALQRHARLRSTERQSRGEFPVSAVGWETLVALMADHAQVIESFYPEHSSQLEQLIAAVRCIPKLDEWRSILAQISSGDKAASIVLLNKWLPINFDGNRGLGPALLGRALGPADVKLCPRLPESEVLIRERGNRMRIWQERNK